MMGSTQRSRARWRARSGRLLAVVLWLACGSAVAAQRPDARGYLTTPLELLIIRQKADEGIEPYATARTEIVAIAATPWLWGFSSTETCPDANTPRWIDNSSGTRWLYANALAYHLTGNASHAQAVRARLEGAMSQVQAFGPDCDTNVGWGAPELVAAADLIEVYWEGLTCTGPQSATPGDNTLGSGPCRTRFQNWLAKAVYPVVSQMATASQNNRGAAGTNTMAHVADYLWDRSDVLLVHHNPSRINGGLDQLFTPEQAFEYARQLTLDRMNGYRIDLGGSSCDYLSGIFQEPSYPPVKSQITAGGIIPEDARRDEFCNVPFYNGFYQNYPQGHIGHNVQHCELLLRRGDRSCYDNQDLSDLPNHPVLGPDDVLRSTHLEPGRGSLERAIKAILIDSSTEWRHDPALEVALQYYLYHGREEGATLWRHEIDDRNACYTDLCLTTVTHGLPSDHPLKGIDVIPGGETLLQDVSVTTGAARMPLEYGSCAEPSGSLQAVRGAGELVGLAYWQDRLYAIERSASGSDAWLVELAGSVCADATRVGAGTVGFSGLEALAACSDGTLYSADWDDASGRSRLIRIDRATGAGALVGSHLMATDLRIVGLSCAPDGTTLWALGAGSGGRPAELLTLSPTTGIESVIGATGTAVGALQALELDRGAVSTRLLAAGAGVYSLDPATGTATLLGGSFAGVRGLAMPQPSAGPDWDNDGIVDALDNCRNLPNFDQLDVNADGYGNACDGDFDNNGIVGAQDFFFFRRAFGLSPGDRFFDLAPDMNGDGVVGTADFSRWLRTFGSPPGPSGLACAGTVPCP
jgi:hypothetical protein